jgi:hypothetical protein
MKFRLHVLLLQQLVFYRATCGHRCELQVQPCGCSPFCWRQWWYGFDNCPIRRALRQEKRIKISEEKWFPGSTEKAPFVLLHDKRPFLWLSSLWDCSHELSCNNNNVVARLITDSLTLCRSRMVMKCSFASRAAKVFLTKGSWDKRRKNAVHVVQAITLLHNVIKDLQDSIELDGHMFTAVKADPRAYMPQSKGNNATSRRAVFARNKFCTFSSAALWCFHNYTSVFHSRYCSFFVTSNITNLYKQIQVYLDLRW